LPVMQTRVGDSWHVQQEKLYRAGRLPTRKANFRLNVLIGGSQYSCIDVHTYIKVVTVNYVYM
jgi:hypothetical protein